VRSESQRESRHGAVHQIKPAPPRLSQRGPDGDISQSFHGGVTLSIWGVSLGVTLRTEARERARTGPHT